MDPFKGSGIIMEERVENIRARYSDYKEIFSFGHGMAASHMYSLLLWQHVQDLFKHKPDLIPA